jgi:CheY-like chemotaxis protein
MMLTVIITDDDPVTLFMHTVTVKKSGLSVAPLIFSNAKDTLAFLDAQLASQEGLGKRFLILLDINMPEMSGWDLLDSIAEKGYRNVCAVVISSSVNVEDHAKANTYKAVIGFLEKPLSEIKLRTLTESVSYNSAWKLINN